MPIETTNFDTVVYEKDGAIARVILNRPEKANTQSSQLVWDFDAALRLADRDYDVKVVIIKANGKGFCAGHDMSHEPGTYPEAEESLARTGTPWRARFELHVWPVVYLWEFPKPTIAQVHGYALGGGTYFALLPDITIASDDAVFQMPLVQGLGYPGGQTMMEPWVFMNFKRAAEYLYTARTLSAEEALSYGLLNQVVPRDQLEATVEAMAAHIAQAPLSTLMTAKAGIKRAWELMGMRLHFQMSTDLMTVASSSSDVHAFMQERGKTFPRVNAARREAALSQGA
jgi:enoyl-CoA hydratase